MNAKIAQKQARQPLQSWFVHKHMVQSEDYNDELTDDEELALRADQVRDEVDDLMDEFWAWRIKESPEMATMVGIHKHDDLLESYSWENFEARKKWCEDKLEIVRDIETHHLTPEGMANLHFLARELEMYVNRFKYFGFVFPINWYEGVQIDFERVVTFMKFRTEADYRKLLARYEAFPRQVEEIMGLLRKAMSMDLVNCVHSMNGVDAQFERIHQCQVMEESPFYQPFLHMPKSFSEALKDDLIHMGQTAVVNMVMPSFDDLHQFIRNEYLPRVREEPACSALPAGPDFYQACLDFHLSFRMKPDDVHEIGLKEVARIHKNMDEVMKKVDFKGSRKDFFEFMRNDPQFYFDDKEDLLAEYRDIVENRITPKIYELFERMPQMELRIDHLPEADVSGIEKYELGNPKSGVRCHFFIGDPDASPKYEMMSLSLHEGLPGHHLQMALAAERTDRPDFRRFIEDRKYSDAPSRFPMYTAFMEGWGLYAEALGEEMDLYEDPYSLFGRYSNELFRAGRLVVDTGLHARGWSRDQAIEYMLNNTGVSEQSVENEIDRYITWPAQACAYKIGEIKIWELRRRAETELGEDFDIRRFHTCLLDCGNSHLTYVESQVAEFIRLEKEKVGVVNGDSPAEDTKADGKTTP